MAQVDADLPPGWHRVASKSHPTKVYYFNEHSRITRWKKPLMSEYKKASKIRCRHVLIKHKDVRNPKSKRTGVAVERSRAEALEHIEGLLKQLKAERADRLEDKIAEMAGKESDCNTFKRGGDLGKFKKESMQKAFAKPAFALKVGELSGVIESDSGFHVVYRVA